MLGKKRFGCPLCFVLLDVRYSKKNKPYCVCDNCGVQLFIRGKEGIERFEQKLLFQNDDLVGLVAGFNQKKD
jgi:hypothetical protein